MTEERSGRLQLYTGCGKGKSTAAFGLAMRASGCGDRVVIIQFRKAQRCGEHVSAEKLGIEIIQCPAGRTGEKCAESCPLLAAANRLLKDGAADLLILDELMAAIKHGCVSEKEARETAALRHGGTELVLTGRNAPDSLIEQADLVTEMKKIKHYYDTGLPARRGIEY